MLAGTLQRLIDEKITTARELGDLAGVSTSTVYRWISGQSRPDFDSVRLLVRHLPDKRAQEAILSVFSAGTAWEFNHQELDLDVNQDGRVDVSDALDATVETVKASADSLQQVRCAHKGVALGAEATLQVISLLNHIVRECNITQRVLVQVAEQKRRRKLKLVD